MTYCENDCDWRRVDIHGRNYRCFRCNTTQDRGYAKMMLLKIHSADSKKAEALKALIACGPVTVYIDAGASEVVMPWELRTGIHEFKVTSKASIIIHGIRGMFEFSGGPSEVYFPWAAVSFKDALDHSCLESPIEIALYDQLPREHQGFVLKPQYEALGGKYRLDFAYIHPNGNKIAIECDGHAHHSSKEDRGRDAKRDRDLIADGWAVLHFTGSEIYKDVSGCAKEILQAIDKLH
jgi:very-short-patch-repair endonuclease